MPPEAPPVPVGSPGASGAVSAATFPESTGRWWQGGVYRRGYADAAATAAANVTAAAPAAIVSAADTAAVNAAQAVCARVALVLSAVYSSSLCVAVPRALIISLII